MAKKVTVPAETIKKIQKDFELDNYEMADLFGLGMSTVLDWLNNGIRGQRGNNIALVESMLALKWLAENKPDKFMSFQQLKDIVHKAIRTPGLLYMDFSAYEEDLGPTISVLKHQRLVSIIMTALFMLYLKGEGKEVELKKTNLTIPESRLY